METIFDIVTIFYCKLSGVFGDKFILFCCKKKNLVERVPSSNMTVSLKKRSKKSQSLSPLFVGVCVFVVCLLCVCCGCCLLWLLFVVVVVCCEGGCCCLLLFVPCCCLFLLFVVVVYCCLFIRPFVTARKDFLLAWTGCDNRGVWATGWSVERRSESQQFEGSLRFFWVRVGPFESFDFSVVFVSSQKVGRRVELHLSMRRPLWSEGGWVFYLVSAVRGDFFQVIDVPVLWCVTSPTTFSV